MPPRHARPGYAYVVIAVVFLTLLASAGLRSTPGVLMLPLEHALHWGRSAISLTAATGILLYGLAGPFAGALMQTYGIRRTLLAALALMAASTGLSALMTQPWQFFLSWGVISGVGSGAVAMVLGATVVNRWFVRRRGLMMGLLSASTATGTMIFLPGLAAIAQTGGWQPVVLTIAAVMTALIPLVFWLVPERPEDVGLHALGTLGDVGPVLGTRRHPLRQAFRVLRRAIDRPAFWLLFGTFFVCGLTTNGLIGTHMIALCADHGLPAVRAAGLLALMGLFDLIGTTGSGWLTDRFDPRKLLFVYYGLRGLSLIYLPFSDFSLLGLTVFATFYGLDWLATVPPTVTLITATVGDADAPIVFGWVAAGHQLGAAVAAMLAGVWRSIEGRYLEAFVASGLLALVAAVMALAIDPARSKTISVGP